MVPLDVELNSAFQMFKAFRKTSWLKKEVEIPGHQFQAQYSIYQPLWYCLQVRHPGIPSSCLHSLTRTLNYSQQYFIHIAMILRSPSVLWGYVLERASIAGKGLFDGVTDIEVLEMLRNERPLPFEVDTHFWDDFGPPGASALVKQLLQRRAILRLTAEDVAQVLLWESIRVLNPYTFQCTL